MKNTNHKQHNSTIHLCSFIWHTQYNILMLLMIELARTVIVVLNSANSRSAPKFKMENTWLTYITFSIFNHLKLIQCSVLTVETD